jgi:hypothetical protein
MAIQRWEMLLSAQTDCYLLKLQGDRKDVDRILEAHPRTCQTVQEISGDIFQWVIFVVDAPLSERLAIQNQVMSLTADTSGTHPSDELLSVLDGLSGALQDLTNLTDDEQAFVMNKMARMGTSAAPTATPLPNPLKTPGPAQAPASPGGAYPPAGRPLPRVTIPGKPNPPSGQKPPSHPLHPVSPGGGIPLPSPGPLPNIIRPVQPPRSFSGVPTGPGPLPPISIPKMAAPPAIPNPPIPKIVPPMPIPQVVPAPPKVSPPPPPAPLPPLVNKEEPPSVPLPPNSDPKEKPIDPIPTLEELKPASVLPVEPVPIVEPWASAPAAPLPEVGVPPPPPPAPSKPDDGATLRISVFYPSGQDQAKDLFMNTLIDVAQKKSRRPTSFLVALSVPTTIALENSTEWIWKAKTSGSDLFFVILPDGLGSELLDPLVGEALSAGLRCFLVPQIEIASKLLYMDLMVELMMFKRRVRPTPA